MDFWFCYGSPCALRISYTILRDSSATAWIPIFDWSSFNIWTKPFLTQSIRCLLKGVSATLLMKTPKTLQHRTKPSIWVSIICGMISSITFPAWHLSFKSRELINVFISALQASENLVIVPRAERLHISKRSPELPGSNVYTAVIKNEIIIASCLRSQTPILSIFSHQTDLNIAATICFSRYHPR